MFKVAGVSKYKGEVKVRFANDMTRVKILDKNGHENINLVELPKEMGKPEIVKYLQTTELYQNQEFKMAIDEAIEKYSAMGKASAVKTGGKKVTVVSKKTVATTVPTKKTASLAELKTRVSKTKVETE